MRILPLLGAALLACAPPPPVAPDVPLSCAAPAAPDQGVDEGVADDPLGLCPSGALVKLSLGALGTLPALAALALPDPPDGALIVPAGDGAEHSVRLDVCVEEGGAATLRSLLLVRSDFEGARRYLLDSSLEQATETFLTTEEGFVHELRLPPAQFLVEGLDALLAGEHAAFELRIVGDAGVLVVGHSDFVALAYGRVDATTIEYTSIDVVVGEVEPGDVFAARRCPFGEQPLDAAFSLGSARFEVSGCGFLGGGHTTGYRIERLRVQDASAELTSDERGCIEVAGADDIDDALDYQWNHHNACDSFYLRLPHAEYAATTSPSAGCGPTVDNAPAPGLFEENDLPVRYRIRYHDGMWRDGTMDDCSHYLFCNP